MTFLKQLKFIILPVSVASSLENIEKSLMKIVSENPDYEVRKIIPLYLKPSVTVNTS